ncbi:MAG: xanthine dehydrogenase family protein molybdopterin-binding subunit [Rhodospirillales bacterium]|nr:xanthine dehydrogenase family protein molybdopterin-binding subunit [Rhodospirillales bacterium]
MTLQTSRRAFLGGTAAAASMMVVGLRSDGALAAGDTRAEINPFVRISGDGTVEVVLKHFEMGQGTSTGLTTLVAEELDADWDKIAIDFAPADDVRYKNLFYGMQGTGGSTAIANSYMQYRQAGAAARHLLVEAAARTWSVPASSISVERGIIRSGDISADFGEMVKLASTLTPPQNPAVKDPSQFRLIGREDLSRKDSASKTDGTATFAIDVTIDGMVYVTILRAPRFGGRLVSFDASGADGMPGFIEAKALPEGRGVAVYAEHTWAAIQAREMITVEWDLSAAENRSTDELAAYHTALLAEPEYQVRAGITTADVDAAIGEADGVIEASYSFPFLAHAPMEPLNCVIEPTENGVRIHDGCQMPGGIKPTLAHVLGLDQDNVEVVTVFAGGSFGRRATPTSDYQVEAALAFALLGGTTPVKLVWTREDDIKGGYYRPMAAHHARIGVTDGTIAGWDHRIAVKSILKGTVFEQFLVRDGVDHISIEGLADTHYALPTLAVGLTDAQSEVPVLWWRSVGHTQNAYVMETLIDRIAAETGRDPVEFRLKLLADGTRDQQRLAGVLGLAAGHAGWGSPAAGRFQGVAVHKSFESYVAEIAEVSVHDGRIKIERVVCAVDCGVAVNPDVVRAQMEGGIGYGLGAVMRNKITLTSGEVDQWNFPDYEPLRIDDMPVIEVHIMPSAEPPTGVGEPGTPPAGPALANAIAAATGTWVTTLPMTDAGIEFV